MDEYGRMDGGMYELINPVFGTIFYNCSIFTKDYLFNHILPKIQSPQVNKTTQGRGNGLQEVTVEGQYSQVAGG